MKSTLLGLWSLPVAAVIGCSHQPKPQPLTPEAFVSPRETSALPGDNPNTGGGTIGENATPAVQLPQNDVANAINKALGQPTTPNAPAGRNLSGAGAPSNVPDVVANEIKPVGSARTGSDSVIPASTTVRPTIGASSGQYMTIAGVVAEVNGVPIYASKVLAMNEVPFREKAKKLDARNFYNQASIDIQKTIAELIQNELEYAAAQKNLDPDDRRIADMATIYWRNQQITAAGGSLELARRASLDEKNEKNNPMDFDERTVEQNRTELIRLYYSKKINPKIQVTAADIREYYDRNVEKLFTTNEVVKFRLIKVDIDDIANGQAKKKEAALNFITDKWKRAKAGEDFKAMAMRENKEKMFAVENPFEIAPKSFAIAPVREALADLKPGEISEILSDSKAFYIVKLEARTEGKVERFEDQNVQERIRNALRAEQLRTMRARELDRLYRDASATPQNEWRIQIALDMAMQRYRVYSASGGK